MSDSDTDTGKNRGIFHRSVSMSAGAPWAKTQDGRIVLMRKRNNSGSELNNGYFFFFLQLTLYLFFI